MHPVRLLFTVCLLTLASARASAQDPVRPFGRVDVGLYGAVNVNRNEFHSYWDAGPAAAVDLVTPFYAGRASLLVRGGTNEAVAGAASSGLTSVFAALGWRLGRSLVEDFRADVGLHVGLTDWMFSDETESAVRYELELAAEASARADYEFAARWHAIAEASYQFAFTHRRIELAYVSLGLARSFTAPGWIRSVLN